MGLFVGWVCDCVCVCVRARARLSATLLAVGKAARSHATVPGSTEAQRSREVQMKGLRGLH